MPRSFVPDVWHLSLAALGLMCVLPFLQPVHAYPLTSFYSEWLAFWFYRVRQDKAGPRLMACTLLLAAGFVLSQALVMLPLFAPDLGLATSSAQRLFESSPGPSARLQLWREAWSVFTRGRFKAKLPDCGILRSNILMNSRLC